MRAAILIAVPLVAVGGCRWTDFDDLKEDTWVTSTGKPDNPSASWAVALTRLQRDGTGGTLAVLGATPAFYNDVVVGPNGDVNIEHGLELNVELSIGNLAIEPLFLSHPEANEVALVTGLEANRIMVARASGGMLTPVRVDNLAQPSGATYLRPPPRAADPDPPVQVLVAQGAKVYGAYFDPAKAPATQTECPLIDEVGAPVNIRSLGAYRPMGATYDDFVVLTDAGKLLVYDGVAFNGCGAPQAPRTGQVKDLRFPMALLGTQILQLEGTPFVLVQVHNDSDRGRLGLYRIGAAAIDEIGTPRELERLRTAALFEPGDGKRYVLAGLPTASVEGVGAGQVQAFELDTATGIAATPAMTLFDAQPEPGQAFGRGVAQLPYNGKKIIAVAADNDVFLYFRTSLYGETREGR